MIRQAIARDQLEAARVELAETHRKALSYEDGDPRDESALRRLPRFWVAQDRHWYWSLQVEAGRLTEKPWTIEGPFAPGEMPADLAASWGNLKRTGVSLANWDGPLEDF